ncbi:cell synthase A catalytic subunit 8 [Dorcoceras hygrometricum]|uniref:Cell synthase A catalytic subunit 8 n=1 Tax=Dorcoceras hygrometricum TaxID=472368 RepID=A0A2Z7A0J2_9LAMI|nr:cell synthase A catalytic subunit 8 [Dorcoceras hygrometricum]
MEPRRLRGHSAAATTCIASQLRPRIVATAGEDGFVCWFDLRCKDVLFKMDVGRGTPVSSLCFKPGNEDIIYVSAGNEVRSFDLHMITFHSKSLFLAAADDTGDVKIIDIQQRCMFKTLRAGHNSICSSVQFLPWKNWEVISGGLDSKLVMWDFSKGRPNKIMDLGDKGDAAQCLNPAFIHCLALPEVDMVDKVGKICAVAKGDGVVSILNIDIELAAPPKSKSSVKPKLGNKSKSTSKDAEASGSQDQDRIDRGLHLDYSIGGHTAAVSSVTFSTFGERGKFIISGGNDKSIKLWDWSKAHEDGMGKHGNQLLCLNINQKKKINWLCTAPSDSENLIVCDTSSVVKVYTLGCTSAEP